MTILVGQHTDSGGDPLQYQTFETSSNNLQNKGFRFRSSSMMQSDNSQTGNLDLEPVLRIETLE